jgi:hypothetical protein
MTGGGDGAFIFILITVHSNEDGGLKVYGDSYNRLSPCRLQYRVVVRCITRTHPFRPILKVFSDSFTF